MKESSTRLPLGNNPVWIIFDSNSSRGMSKASAITMCRKAELGPPCVHIALWVGVVKECSIRRSPCWTTDRKYRRIIIEKYLTVPPFDSSSRPSCGSAEHLRIVDEDVPNFTPSLAKFPICWWVEVKGFKDHFSCLCGINKRPPLECEELTLKRAVMRNSGRMTKTNPQRTIWIFNSIVGVSGFHWSREQTGCTERRKEIGI